MGCRDYAPSLQPPQGGQQASLCDVLDWLPSQIREDVLLQPAEVALRMVWNYVVPVNILPPLARDGFERISSRQFCLGLLLPARCTRIDAAV